MKRIHAMIFALSIGIAMCAVKNTYGHEIAIAIYLVFIYCIIMSFGR